MNNEILDVSNISGDSFFQETIPDKPVINSSNLIYEEVIKFLDKLKSNPDVETIKWPSRIKDIERLEKKLNKILKENAHG